VHVTSAMTAAAKHAVFDCLCELVSAALPCDWSHVLLRQARPDAFVPVSCCGDPPGRWDAIRQLRVPAADAAAFLARFKQHDVVQVTSADLPLIAQPMLYGVPQALCVALRRGVRIVALLTAGYQHGYPRFSPQQERIARGIAHLAGLAMHKAVPRVHPSDPRAAERMAAASHELRTPLSVIRGYNDLLLDGVFGPITAEQNDILRRMDKNVRQSLDLIHTIVEPGGVEPEWAFGPAPERHERY
jgi:signal transduction histidine kinase